MFPGILAIPDIPNILDIPDIPDDQAPENTAEGTDAFADAKKDAAGEGMALGYGALDEEKILPELGDLDDDGNYILQDIQFSSVQARNRKLKEAKAYYAETVQYIEEMFDRDAVKLYSDLFSRPALLDSLAEKCGIELPDSIEEICRRTVDDISVGVLTYEDASAVCLLKVKLGDTPGTTKIKHVIIDEVQDYSPAQLEMIHGLFSGAGMTLLGDRSQTINRLCDYDWEDMEQVFANDNSMSISLNKAYRSTVEINRFAGRILGIEDEVDSVSRHGDEPAIIVTDVDSGYDSHIQAVVDEFKRLEEKGYFSIGILCTNENETEEAYKMLNPFLPIRRVYPKDTTFHSGPCILSAFLAKGLEFDAVIVFNCNEDRYPNENHANLLYTACTRPLHSLSLCSYGEPTALLRLDEERKKSDRRGCL